MSEITGFSATFICGNSLLKEAPTAYTQESNYSLVHEADGFHSNE